MEIIDAHTHVWTPDTERYPLAPGFTKEDMQPASWTPEEFLAAARPEGVTKAVLIQMSYYSFPKSGSRPANGYPPNCFDKPLAEYQLLPPALLCRTARTARAAGPGGR